jgi:hypothetical protein
LTTQSISTFTAQYNTPPAKMKVQALTAVTLTALLTISAAIPIAEPAQGDGLEARKVTDRKGHPQWGYDAGAFAGNGP